MIIYLCDCSCQRRNIKMNIIIYQELIKDLISQGIKVHDLTLLQIRSSIQLYKSLFN